MQLAKQAKKVKVNNQIASVLALAPKEPVMLKDEQPTQPTNEVKIALEGLPTPIMKVWKTSEFSIYSFYINHGNIDLEPVEQRDSIDKEKNGTHSTPSKSQGIIDAILRGMDIGEIALEVRTWEGGKWKSIKEYKNTQSGDGGHRCRSIVAFMKGEFHTHHACHLGKALYFSDLPQIWKDHIGNYMMRTVVHYPESSREIGMNMYQANIGDAPIFIETVNYYGTLLQLMVNRDIVYGTHPNGDCHELFELKNGKAKHLAVENKRMLWLLWTVQSSIMHGKGEFGSVTQKEIMNWLDVEFKKPQINGLKKNLTEEYDYYLNLAIAFKKARGGSGKAGVMYFHLFRMTYWIFKEMSPRFSSKDVIDFEKIAEAIIEADITFQEENEKVFWRDENGKYFDQNKKTIGDAYQSYVKKIEHEVRVMQAMTWFKSAFNTKGLIQVKSETGSFTQKQVEKRWIHVGKIDEVDLQPISLADAIGCHIIADANGGLNTDDNIMVSKEKHNIAMGTTNGKDYARAYQQANGLPIREFPK